MESVTAFDSLRHEKVGGEFIPCSLSFKSKVKAKWMLSDKLQEAFKEGGVIGQPKYVFNE